MARVVLTQPLPRVEALAEMLAARGHDVLGMPFIRIAPLQQRALRDEIRRYRWVIPVSPAAVAQLAAALEGIWPSGAVGLGLIGPGSVRALEESGLPVPAGHVVVPVGPTYDAGALLQTAEFNAVQGASILVLRGEGGREDWIDTLRSRGAEVTVQALYERVEVQPEPAARDRLGRWLQEGLRVHCVFTQASAVDNLCALNESGALVGPEGLGTALVIHDRIADRARSAGFNQVITIAPGESAIAAALE